MQNTLEKGSLQIHSQKEKREIRMKELDMRCVINDVIKKKLEKGNKEMKKIRLEQCLVWNALEKGRRLQIHSRKER